MILKEEPKGGDRHTTARGTPVPDLELFVELGGGGRSLDFKMRAIPLGFTDRAVGSQRLRRDPESYLRKALHRAGFSNPSRWQPGTPGSGSMQRAEKRMRNGGRFLAKELLPDGLLQELSRFRQDVATLQIQSEESWIPWELLSLSCSATHNATGGNYFLCERFDVTHWLPGRDLPAQLAGARATEVKSIAVMAPEGPSLRQVRSEVQFLLGLQDRGFVVDRIPATTDRIVEALASEKYDLFHFAGHGRVSHFSDPDASEVIGNDGDSLTPSQLVGEIEYLGERAPIIFFNSCYSGGQGFSLTGRGGWAARFVSLGAAAFVGPYWTVPDRVALAFCVSFYEAFLGGETLAASMGAARRHTRKAGDPSWLAYSAYSHPLLRCRLPTPPRAVQCTGEQTAEREVKATRPESKGSRQCEKRTPQEADRPAAEPPLVLVSQPRPEVAPEQAVTAQEPPTGERPAETDRRAGSRASPRRQRAQVERPVAAPSIVRIHPQSGIPFVFVPGGRFTLGTGGLARFCGPDHEVSLRDYWIARYPVTNGCYRRFLADRADQPDPAFWHDPRFNAADQPVVGVSWSEASAFCSWAGLELPSEAQWEAAARGTGARRYPWGDDPPGYERAVFAPHAAGPAPVDRSGSDGPFGTVGQAGNVAEWCQDAWDAKAYRGRHLSTDPVVVTGGAMRVVRGGSWRSPARDLRAALRERCSMRARVNTQGFRCVWNGSAQSSLAGGGRRQGDERPVCAEKKRDGLGSV